MNKNALLATLTCPNPACQHQQRAMMPTTACQLTYTCEACSMTHGCKRGDCCVFCSYADKLCPSMQEERTCDPLCSPDR
ncbi:MAG TPA: GDCCVxC domain-containing (seleno)protein [Ktedonobacteraceae bacterium]